MAATQDGKTIVYHRSTGERFERWAIDAREMIATGEYTTDPPDGYVEPAAPPPPALGIPELPKEIAPGVPAVYSSGPVPVTAFAPPVGRTPKKAP